jgi:uncharacterized protein involved in response to NO
MTTVEIASRRFDRRTRRCALFAYGFRPFFLLVGIYGVLSVGAWILMWYGRLELPVAWPPTIWHAHEMIFGFAMAGIAGFILTAVPDWTRSPPVRGGYLVFLVALWLAGRAVMWASAALPLGAVAAVDLAFVPALAAPAARALLKPGARRNLPIFGLLMLFVAANALTHAEALGLPPDAARTGSTLGLGVVLVTITLIGGRIIPAFTTNALRRRGATRLPRKLPVLDALSVASVMVAVVAWLFDAAAVPAFIAAALNAARLLLWRPWATLFSPILWVLHLGYAWLVAGLVLTGLAGVLDGVPPAAPIHAFAVGAVATMLLAVMSRAALGHTGRPLVAHPATTAAYVLVSLAAVLRICAALAPETHAAALGVAGAAWVVAFALFVTVYGPVLVSPRVDGRPG